MHALIALAVGVLVAWAVRPSWREQNEQPLGWWRVAAGAAGGLYPYADVLLYLLGSGAYAQLGNGLLWALPLVPFHAVVVAGVLHVVSGRAFPPLYMAVFAAMMAVVLLALFTTEGIAPLALLWDGRVGLNVLYEFDALVLGLAVLSLMMGGIFYPFRHLVARMGLVCMVLYVVSTAGFAWQARGVGYAHAAAQNLTNPVVVALPQPISPLNWRVLIWDDKGMLHDTLINLKRTEVVKLPDQGATRAARIDALYRPVGKAVWRVYDRFGAAGEDDEDARTRAQRAYEVWQGGVFGWQARFAVYDGILEKTISRTPTVCVKFVDIRYDGARDRAKGETVVCPTPRGNARLLKPRGSGLTELVPLMGK